MRAPINPRPEPVYHVATLPSGRRVRIVSHPTNAPTWDVRNARGALVAVGTF